MIRLTRGLRVVLGLCLLALGVFGVSAAQAAPTWMVGGAALGTGASKEVKASIVAPEASLHTKIGGNTVDFNCTGGKLVSVSLIEKGELSTGGSVEFTGCSTKVNGTTQGACKPNDKGIHSGVILSNKGKGRLTEHSTGEGVTIIESTVEEKIEGKVVPVFGHVEMGEECSIGENVPIIGSKLGVVDSGGMTGLLAEATSHNIKELPVN